MENVTFISPREVKELIGKMDVEKKADDIIPNLLHKKYVKTGFIAGYNQALEDNKEKAIIFICKYLGVEKDSIIYNKIIKDWEQSLQPKTECDVEFDEHGKLKLKK